MQLSQRRGLVAAIILLGAAWRVESCSPEPAAVDFLTTVFMVHSFPACCCSSAFILAFSASLLMLLQRLRHASNDHYCIHKLCSFAVTVSAALFSLCCPRPVSVRTASPFRVLVLPSALTFRCVSLLLKF